MKNTLVILFISVLSIFSSVATAQGLDLKKLQAQGRPEKQVSIKYYTYVFPQTNSAESFRLRKWMPEVQEFAGPEAFYAANLNIQGGKLVLGKGIWVTSSQFNLCPGVGTIIEGQGSDTIVVSEKFFKDPAAGFSLFAQRGCTFKNLTFVNARYESNRNFGDQFWNVHFAGSFGFYKDFQPQDKLTIFRCFGCIFDQAELFGYEKTHTIHVGSVLWNPAKKAYLPYEKKDFGQFLNALGADFENKHAGGKLVQPDKAVAKTTFMSLIGAPRKQNGMLVRDEISPAIGEAEDGYNGGLVRNGLGTMLAEQYGFEKIYEPQEFTAEELKAKVAEELKADRPLSALVYIGRAEKNSSLGSAVSEAKALVKPKLEALAKRVKPCEVKVEYSAEFLKSKSVSLSDDFKEERGSGGTLYSIIMNDISTGTLPTKYPFLAMGNSGNCVMLITLTEDKLNSWVEEQDRKIGFHKEIDFEAMYRAEMARAAARTAAIANLSASMQSSFASMDNTWRTFMNTRTHFEQHVGGTDLVSYKVKTNDSHQRNQSNLDSQRDAINASSGGGGSPEKMVRHDVVTWHRVGDAEVAGKISFAKPDRKAEVYDLPKMKGKWTMSQCTTKYRTDGTDYKEISENWSTCKEDLQKGYFPAYGYQYAELNIYPFIDRYLDTNVLKATTAEMQSAKTGKGAAKLEAILFYRWMGVALSDAQKIAMLDHFSSVDAESEFVRGAISVAK